VKEIAGHPGQGTAPGPWRRVPPDQGAPLQPSRSAPTTFPPAPRAPAPALTAAGAGCVGAWLGAACGAPTRPPLTATAGTSSEAQPGVCTPHALPGDPGAWSIAAAGALVLFAALLQARGTRPRSHRLRAPLLIGALAVLCAGRAAMARPVHWRVEGQPVVGHVHELRSFSDRGNGTEAWTLGTEAGLLVAPRGSLAPGDLIAVDGNARRAGRARSLHRPLAPRTSSLRPRADEVVRRPGGPASPPASAGAIHRLRRRGIRACLAHPDPASAGLLAALVFGDRSGLTPELTDLFTRTGTRHLLALSGFHVGLLTVLLLLPLARAIAALLRQGAAATGRTARPGGALLAAAMVMAFVPLSGGGAPATRAAVGLGLALVSGRLRRRPSVLNLMGVAALIELGLDPLAPTRPGTQLSYLATAALVLAAGPVARALCGAAASEPRGSGWLAPVGPTGWPRPALLVALVERLRLLCWAALSAGAVASLATLPVVWSVFGEWSPASLLATPVATPPVALLVTTGWLRLLLPFEGLDHLSSWGAAGLIAWLEWVDRLPWTPLPLPERSPALVFLACALLGAACLRPARRSSGRLAYLGAAGLGALLLPWPGPALGPDAPGPIPATLEVHVLDVGNGTAVVARAPRAPTWILDAGSRDRLAVADEGVGALLRGLDTGAIRVGVSHDHADHAAALPWVTGRWEAEGFHGPRSEDAAGVARHPRGIAWLDSALNGDERPPLRVAAIASGMADPNEGSALFDLRWRAPSGRTFRVVLCGDAEGQGLRAILDGGGGSPWLEPGPVDLLLLPHHGSRTRYLAQLLDRLQPALAVVSGSTPEYAPELARRGIPLHVTGRDGPLLWRPTGAPAGTRPPEPEIHGADRHPSRAEAYTRQLAAPIHATCAPLGGAVPMLKPLFISLAVAVGLSAPGHGLEVAPQAKGELPAQDDPAPSPAKERAVKRVLRLRGGSVLRGPSRRTPSGQWSIKAGSEWRTVPAAMVLEAVEERVALEQLRALREEQGRSPAEQVDGALALGLLPEACGLCDELLELHPTDTDLRGAAARAGRYLGGLPGRGDTDELERLLDLGAGPSLLMREVVVERLVTATDRSNLARTLRAELRGKRPSRRAFAAFATGRLFPSEDPRPLLIHAVYDPSPLARESAARAISDVGAYEVAGPLVRAVESGNGAVRLRAVEALGASRDAAFVEPLMGRLYTLTARSGGGSGYRPPRSHLFVGTQRAYVQDFDVEVAQGSSVADPVVNTLVEGVVLDVSVIGVQEVEVRTELRVIRGALGRITGRKPGSSNKAWRSWWESEEAGPFRRPAEEETDAPPSSHGETSRRR